MSENLLKADLDLILKASEPSLHMLQGKRLFLTGGTGFFGKWLLETCLWANQTSNLDLNVLVLSRDPGNFLAQYPRFDHQSSISFCQGDIRDFAFPAFNPDFIIHGATTASAQLNKSKPGLMFETIVSGTRRVLDYARKTSPQKILITSSGAVYGKQPHDLFHLPEDYPGSPATDDPLSAYGEGKRASELLGSICYHETDIDVIISRSFAFVGPYLPLDGNFAIGNFIADGLRGRNIIVEGDGTPIRSYMYAADLVIWLLKMLTHGKSCYPYNLGSENDISILQLARKVASFFPGIEIEVRDSATQGSKIERYVPNTGRAKNELGLTEHTTLEEAIQKSITFNKALNPA